MRLHLLSSPVWRGIIKRNRARCLPAAYLAGVREGMMALSLLN